MGFLLPEKNESKLLIHTVVQRSVHPDKTSLFHSLNFEKQSSDLSLSCQRGHPTSFASYVRTAVAEMISTSCFSCRPLSNKLLCNCSEKLGTTQVEGDSLTCYGELLPLILIAWWKLGFAFCLYSCFV